MRHAVGATGAIAVAYLFLDGIARLVAYAIAAIDLLVTPRILKRAVDG